MKSVIIDEIDEVPKLPLLQNQPEKTNIPIKILSLTNDTPIHI